MLKAILRPWVFAALAAVLAYVAQLFVVPGIFLMMVGAILWPGALMHLALILLAVDCLTGKTPKPLLVVPVVFYAIGLGMFAISAYDAYTLSRHVAAMDERREIAYDPARTVVLFADEDRDIHSLARVVQAAYKLDLVYEGDSGSPTQFRALRVLPQERCPDRRQLPRHHWVNWFHLRGAFVRNACVLNTPSRPDQAPIVIRTTTSELRWGFETATIMRTEISSGAERAVLHTARTQVYPPVLFLFAGCALNSGAASWDCMSAWAKVPREVGGNGEQDNGAQIAFVGETLGVRPRVLRITRPARGPLMRAEGAVDFAEPVVRSETLLRGR